MLVYPTNPVEGELFSYVKTFCLFQYICVAARHVSETLYKICTSVAVLCATEREEDR